MSVLFRCNLKTWCTTKKKSELTEVQKTWIIVQLKHFLEETMLNRLVVTLVFSMVSLSQTKNEAWWSILKQDTLQTWINYFKDLWGSGAYDDRDIIHVEALRFCFHASLQGDLDDIKEYWNNHKIRKFHAAESPDGRAELMYVCLKIIVIMNLKFLCACQILAQYHQFTVLHEITGSVVQWNLLN